MLASIVLVSTGYVACGSADQHTFGTGSATGGQGGSSGGTSAGGGSGSGGTNAGGGTGGGGTAGGGGSSGAGGGSGTGGSIRDSSLDAPDDGPLSNSG